MAVPFIKATFALGELAPTLFGRVDLARFSAAASTARNCYVRYQGGLSSRAGTKFVGYSKQTGRSFPPRLITFQFNINQGLALEFGNHYMRVIQNGAFVTEAPLLITGITQANPGVVTFSPASGVASATVNIGGVIASYAPGDTVTLAGGSSFAPGVLSVTTTQVSGLQLGAGGSSYAPADTIVLAGGTPITNAVVTVDTVNGSGAILTFHVSTVGSYSANPAGLTFTQSSTSGSGTAATFQFALMAPLAVAVQTPGIYTVFPTNPVSQASSSGHGLGATFNLTSTTVSALQTDDWVEIDGVQGMTQVNGNTYVVVSATTTTITLADVFGTPLDTTGFSPYVSGGTLSRIFTISTIYAEQDLRYLKVTQSNDVMTLCLVNQQTLVEYPPQDLARTSNTNWTFEEVVASATVQPPTNVAGTASSGGTTEYQYVVTSVDPNNGSESVASNIATISGAVDVAGTAGTITITWTPVSGVNQYNIYKAEPVFSPAVVAAGSQFGFAGTSFGTSFNDSNIVQDFTQVPPEHDDPFARGQILGATPIAGGSGYSTAAAIINTITGSGAVLVVIVQNNMVTGIIIDNPGKNYSPQDTITITGDGTGATASLTVGPETGTYPAVPTYFQERRGYGYTINQPDTYFFSQPDSFKDFDSRIPTIASDAIIGSPWSVQVNGIQAMLNRPGGLVVFTGKEAWQLTGTGGSSLNPQPITPSTQQAQPQAFNGCSDHVPPLGVDNEILYVQAKGSIVRDLTYNYFTNSYTGSDLTLNSSHLFTGYQVLEWGWAEEPFKTAWAVRNDGILLCLTFVKPQEVAAWTRSDTNGIFVSVATVTELPVDAVYLATQRMPEQGSAYMIERMDNRIWNAVEDAWCVDCGLRLDQPTPDATLTVSSARGAGTIPSITVAAGGVGYGPNTTATVVDDDGEGPGTGCTVALTIVAGVITAATPTGGSGYTYPAVTLDDPSNGGSGASLVPVLSNTATATASGPVFLLGNVSDVIRSGGGIMAVTGFTSSTVVTVNITAPIVQVTVDAAGNETPLPQTSGNWSMTQPVSQIGNLTHLEGLVVTGTYDGHVIPPVTVPSTGIIDLPAPATAVTAGLGFAVQVQSPYFSVQGQAVDGHRKKIADVVVRVEDSLGFTIGSNQPDGSALAPSQIAPVWNDMQDVERPPANFERPPYGSTVEPLWTGDSEFVPVISGFGVPGQVCAQQELPLPLNLLAFVMAIWPGDTPQVQEPKGADRMGANG